MILQGIAELLRCAIAMRSGQWLERLDDVRETEDMLMHMDETKIPIIVHGAK